MRGKTRRHPRSIRLQVGFLGLDKASEAAVTVRPLEAAGRTSSRGRGDGKILCVEVPLAIVPYGTATLKRKDEASFSLLGLVFLELDPRVRLLEGTTTRFVGAIEDL